MSLHDLQSEHIAASAPHRLSNLAHMHLLRSSGFPDGLRVLDVSSSRSTSNHVQEHVLTQALQGHELREETMGGAQHTRPRGIITPIALARPRANLLFNRETRIPIHTPIPIAHLIHTRVLQSAPYG